MSAVTPSKYFEIEKYSHHFVLRNMSPSGQQVAERFARNYIQYGMIKVGRFFKRGPVKVFAAKISRKNEIRFHDVIEFLEKELQAQTSPAEATAPVPA